MTTLISKSVYIGEKLRRLQRDRNVTNKELWQAFDVPHNEISRWRYMKDMKLSMAIEIANYFGITLDEFVNYE
jgi:plasmid maintenance system antidote protein VapI